MRQHIDLYQNGALVARFTEGAATADYFGAAGQIVRAKVEADHCTHNPWTGDLRYGGLQREDFLWLLSSVESALRDDGYDYDVQGATPPFGVPNATQHFPQGERGDDMTTTIANPRLATEDRLKELQLAVQEAVSRYMEEYPDDDLLTRLVLFREMEEAVRALGEALCVPPPPTN